MWDFPVENRSPDMRRSGARRQAHRGRAARAIRRERHAEAGNGTDPPGADLPREGFAGTTMRMVAEEAGVSTGMLNHYFENRLDLLTQALAYSSERSLVR